MAAVSSVTWQILLQWRHMKTLYCCEPTLLAQILRWSMLKYRAPPNSSVEIRGKKKSQEFEMNQVTQLVNLTWLVRWRRGRAMSLIPVQAWPRISWSNQHCLLCRQMHVDIRMLNFYWIRIMWSKMHVCNFNIGWKFGNCVWNKVERVADYWWRSILEFWAWLWMLTTTFVSSSDNEFAYIMSRDGMQPCFIFSTFKHLILA